MSAISDIGTHLVALRRAVGMTQRQLGERLGVKQPQIARWEADCYASVSLARVSAVAEALGADWTTATQPIAAESSATYLPASAATDPGLGALQRLGVDPEALAAFCRSHGITRLELFGSVLTPDFSRTSDVDVLVTYAAGRTPSLLGAVDYEAELSAILRRPVDLVTRASVERSDNHVRRAQILDGARTVYEV